MTCRGPHLVILAVALLLYSGDLRAEGGETVRTSSLTRAKWLAGRGPSDPLPAANFWSITLCDAENASGLQNGQRFPTIGSLDDIEPNDDGSVDLVFGPEQPGGVPESNWRRTVPGKGWFPYFRLYSPKQAFLDRTWVLPDIEKAR